LVGRGLTGRGAGAFIHVKTEPGESRGIYAGRKKTAAEGGVAKQS